MKPLILIIALVVLAGCESRYTWVTGRQGYETIGGHLYRADTTHRIDLIHAEHCACKGGGK